MRTTLYVAKLVVFFVFPLAGMLSVALGWSIVRGTALASAFAFSVYFAAYVMRTEGVQDGDDADDGDGGGQDEDEIPPPPEARLLFEVTQPERNEWRN